MKPHRRVAIAIGLHQTGPQHHAVLAGALRFARDHPTWQCIFNEAPGGPFHRADGRPGYDGVLARASRWLHDQMTEAGVPLVSTRYGQGQRGVAGVYENNRACGEMAAEHLCSRGFRRLACLVENDFKYSDAIASAFARAAEQRGASCNARTVDTGTRPEREFWELMREVLDPMLDQLTPPVGVLTTMPVAARVLATLCLERGWRVAQDVAIICTRNVPSLLEAPPQITSIDCNHEQIGYEAAALLEQMMADPNAPPRQIIVEPRGVITRESTDYFAVEDQRVAQAMQFIAKHLREDLSIIRLANELSISQRTLQRRFEAALDRPLATEIRRLRLEAAKRLLTDRTLQIGQIATEVGFGSATTMNLLFHRELGMSPTAYRKQVIGR